MTQQVKVRELVAWGLDENRYRPSMDPTTIERARSQLNHRHVVETCDSALQGIPADAEKFLSEQRQRGDLHEEMVGLEWQTGIVDLNGLFAFQRRLVFDDRAAHADVPGSKDWKALVEMSFGPPIPLSYNTLSSDLSRYLIQSENPNLQLRPSKQGHRIFDVHTGSPFFEVADYKGRWFLRDGYHRAYRLLRAEVTQVPAVIIHARSLGELGAQQPWFFSEDTLFSAYAPRVSDFLDDALTVDYVRPRLLKTLRISIEESIEPAFVPKIAGENP